MAKPSAAAVQAGLSRPEPALVGYIRRSERCERPMPDSNATALWQSCLSLKLNVSSPCQPAMGIAEHATRSQSRSESRRCGSTTATATAAVPA